MHGKCMYSFVQTMLYAFFLPQGVKIELIFALRAAVYEIRDEFQNCQIWAWNLAIGQSARSCTYALFLPHGVKIEPILLYELWFPRYGPISKLPYLGMKLCHWPKCKKLHIYPLSTRGGEKLSLFSLYGQWFPRYGLIFKLPYLGLKLGHWPKFQKLHIYPRGPILSLFLLYGLRFSRYGPVFKIPIFGHVTWPLANVPEVAHVPSFYPGAGVGGGGSEIELIFAVRAAISKIRDDFQNAIFGHENWPLAKVQEVVHMHSFYPKG